MAGTAELGTSSSGEWRRNWTLVMAGVVGMATVSIHSSSLGVMVMPLEAEFGWSRTEITSGFLILTIVGFFFNIPMGYAVDRFGARPVALGGMFTYCAAIVLLGTATASVFMWWLLWFIVALGQLQLKPTTWVASVSGAFDKSRGLALAVVLSGTGLAAFAVPIITQTLVSSFGWSAAYMMMGSFWAVVAIPIIWIFFYDGRRQSASQKNRKTTNAAVSVPPPEVDGVSLKEGLFSPLFLRIATAVTLMALVGTGLMLNVVPVLASKDIDVTFAAVLAGVAGITAIGGRIASGYLIDRIDARIIAAVAVTLPAVACACFLGLPGPVWLTVLGVVLLGLGSGAEMDAMAYMAGRYFGLRNLGALFGALMSCMTLGVGFGPVLASFTFDMTKSYDLALWLAIPISLFSALLFITAPAFPKPEAG